MAESRETYTYYLCAQPGQPMTFAKAGALFAPAETVNIYIDRVGTASANPSEPKQRATRQNHSRQSARRGFWNG